MSMETIHDRHDRVVKLVLGRPANMRSLLQAGLSRETVGRVDWDKIDYLSTELPRADSRALRADIVVVLPLVGGGRYIAVLEHKSSADSGTRHQVVGYVVAIEREHNAHRRVIPIVFYHGDTPWVESAEGGPAEAWDFAMIVLSVRGVVLQKAQLTVELRALVEVLRAGRGVSDAVVLTELATDYLRPLYKQYEESRVVFDELVRYILGVAERAKGLTRSEVLQIIEKQTGKEAREMGKSFLDEAWAEGERTGKAVGLLEGERRGVDKGRTEGRFEGRNEGRFEGRTEGKAEVAQRMLQEHVDEVFIGRVTGLSASTIEELRHSLNGS